MTADAWMALLPLVILAAAVIVLLLLLAFYRRHEVTLALTLLALALAFAALFLAPASSVQATPLVIIDGYSRFFMGLMFAATFAIALFSYGYFAARSDSPEEAYVLLLLATIGASVLIASSHFASFFLGLEILSVSLYALLAFLRTSERGVEAGIKYLVLAGASSGFLLFGMALVYAESGTMEFARIASFQPVGSNVQNLVMLTGLGLLVVGMGFKLAVVPFHLWTPDVYEGAPAPITAFVASVSKGAMFALVLRYFSLVNVQAYRSIFLAFVLIALASMIIGNLLALLQNNVKRILAYSSIAHLGYLLVAFLASGPLGVMAVAFYLVAYFVTIIGAFGVVTVMSREGRDADSIDDYRGLFQRNPRVAVVFTAMLLSLAGIPLTAGFVGKFYLVAAGVSSALWLLVIVLVLSSSIGLFYYLRIIVAIYAAPQGGEAAKQRVHLPLAGSLVLAVLTLFLVWLGVYPAPLIALIQSIVRIG